MSIHRHSAIKHPRKNKIPVPRQEPDNPKIQSLTVPYSKTAYPWANFYYYYYHSTTMTTTPTTTMTTTTTTTILGPLYKQPALAGDLSKDTEDSIYSNVLLPMPFLMVTTAFHCGVDTRVLLIGTTCTAFIPHSFTTTTTTRTRTTTTTILRPFVRDYPGEPVPEETFTHPPSWSSSNLYQLLPSTMIHSILPVQIACLAIFLHNLSTRPFWSTSCSCWSGALHLIFHTFLQPISVFFSQNMPIPSQRVLL